MENKKVFQSNTNCPLADRQTEPSLNISGQGPVEPEPSWKVFPYDRERGLCMARGAGVPVC